VVIAFAGRRVDPPAADPARFPPENEGMVGDRIRRRFRELGAGKLVASAACGADLLAHEAARDLGIDSVVVLPWARDRFRERSVVDRGSDWGERFDRMADVAASRGDLRVLSLPDEGDAAYDATNYAILDLAGELAQGGQPADSVVAVVAWDGQSRGATDFTERFMRAARARAMEVVEIMTR
jgi:hypothetical protein